MGKLNAHTCARAHTQACTRVILGRVFQKRPPRSLVSGKWVSLLKDFASSYLS